MEQKFSFKKFENAITKWLTACEQAHDYVKSVLENAGGKVNLKPYYPDSATYRFISIDRDLHILGAYISDSGIVRIFADEDLEGELPYVLDWEDIAQDVPTIADFVTAVHEWDLEHNN